VGDFFCPEAYYYTQAWAKKSFNVRDMAQNLDFDLDCV